MSRARSPNYRGHLRTRDVIGAVAALLIVFSIPVGARYAGIEPRDAVQGPPKFALAKSTRVRAPGSI